MNGKRRLNKKTPKNKTNKQWVNRHINDPFVKKAQGQGYRSRAVFKLEEIQNQFCTRRGVAIHNAQLF